MIESRAFVLGIFIGIVLFLSCFFYAVEGFVTDNTHDSHIHVTETGPIDSIQIRYDGNREDKDRYGNINEVPINLAQLVIYDKNHKRIPYWNGQVYFEGGILAGHPVHYLWDDNINSIAHSSGSRANLIVNLNPPQEIGSIQLTNRNDGRRNPDGRYEYDHRIQNYNLVLYKGGRVIGETKLFQLGYKGKTVNYIVLNGSLKGEKGAKGEDGPKGQPGPLGSQGSKGDKGDLGTKGAKGIDGNNGTQGPKGGIGPQGPKGFIGPIGYIGAQGSQGIKGIIGPKGIQGIDGIRGEVGNIGTDGVPGGKCFRE